MQSDDLIKKANDPNFKSLIAKLLARKWLDEVLDIPKTGTECRHIAFSWTERGQMGLVALKFKMEFSAFWNEANEFLDTLNEQEETFFNANILSSVPDAD